MKLYDTVVEAYEIACENGYKLDEMAAIDVATDMATCNSDLETVEIDKIRVQILKYRGY